MTDASITAPSPQPSSPADSSPILEFRNVSIAFAGRPVLKDISFTVGSNETRILLGPAGVGKSVLLKLSNGLLYPDSGSIHLFGEDISHIPEQDLFPLRTRTGMVFQEGALFDSLTVRDNVAYLLIQQKVPDDEIDARVHQALRFVGLERDLQPFSRKPLRRHAAPRCDRPRAHPQSAASAYDSPTGGLDPVTSTTIIELIVKQRDVYYSPSLLVTHRLQDAFTMCTHRFDTAQDRMVPLPEGQFDTNTTFLMLDEGRMIFDGISARAR